MQNRKVSPKPGKQTAKTMENLMAKSNTKSKSPKKVPDSSPSVSLSKVSNGSNGKVNSSKKAKLAEAQFSKPVDSKSKSLSPEKKVAHFKKTKFDQTNLSAKKVTKDKAESISPRSKSPEPQNQSPKKKLSQSRKQVVNPQPEGKQEVAIGFRLSYICQMVKPKKPQATYLIYSNIRRPQIQAENQDLSMTDISKIIGKEWTMISSGQKQELNLLAEKDIQRYQLEMEQFETQGWFINSNGEKSTNLVLQNPKFHDDIVQPKKPSTGYMFFVKEEVQSIKKSDPSMKLTEITKLCGLKWQAMSLQDMEKFQQLCEQDQIRYKNEIRQLLTVGYFVDSQGIKSTDKQVKQKKIQHAQQKSVKSDNTTAPTFGSLEAQSQISAASSSSQKKKASPRIKN